MAIGLLASEGTFYQQRASFGRGTPRCAGVGQCHLALNVEGTSPSGRLEKSIKEHIEGGSEGATGRRVPHNLYRPSVVCELLGIERKRHVIQVAHDKHWRLARQMQGYKLDRNCGTVNRSVSLALHDCVGVPERPPLGTPWKSTTPIPLPKLNQVPLLSPFPATVWK